MPLPATWTSVQSSRIEEVAYNPDNKTLLVRFPSGKIAEYEGVSVEVYNGLVSAESAGRYFGTHIATLPYRYV